MSRLGLIASLLVSLTLALAPAAGAGEATSTPPMFRGDLALGYHGGVDLVQLEDRVDAELGKTRVADYAEHRQGMYLGGMFSVFHGIALRLELPIDFFHRRIWNEATELSFDPDLQQTTTASSVPLSPDVLDKAPSSRTHRGPGDLGIGFRLVPFAQTGVPGRVAPASLALDFEAFAPSGGSHDQVRPDGSAGPGVGGAQVRVAMTGSRKLRNAEPHLSIGYLHRAPYLVDLSEAQAVPSTDVEEDGRTRLDPADEFFLRFGAELTAFEDVKADTGVRIQVGLGMTYVAPHEISSGTELPVALEQTVGHRAISGEHVVIEGKLGIRARTQPQAELRFDVGGAWFSPHLVEQVDESSYGVRTAASSFRVSWLLGTAIRFR